MKVFLKPTGLHSRSMSRVARALARFMPVGWEVVDDPALADLRFVHVIGEGSLEGVDVEQPHVLIQYCARSAGRTLEQWAWRWRSALLVWSYYDLRSLADGDYRFLYAPLGVDDVFADSVPAGPRHIGIMTSGYVSGPNAEAIEECAIAAERAGTSVLHLGPSNIEGMTWVPRSPRTWEWVHEVPDHRLADLYGWSRYVSGLRHIEGFELPVIEGLACGARPIVFDRPEMRYWYGDHAVFVPPSSGEELVDHLVRVFEDDYWAVTEEERTWVRHTFDWRTIAGLVWSTVADLMEVKCETVAVDR